MSQSLSTPNQTQMFPANSIEISVRGRWVRVPALAVGPTNVVVTGKWIKIAAIHDEEWLETEIEDPGVYVTKLKEEGSEVPADIFTFTQKLPGAPPKHSGHLEWASMAAIRLPGFTKWWEKLPQETRKNVRRSQKRGVVVSVKPFNQDLIAGIRDVNDDSPLRQRIRNFHYGKSLAEIKKDYSAFLDRSDFICAKVGNEMLGFLKLVYRGEVASILHLTTKVSQSDKRPANALVAKAVELCEAKGISFITYGEFNYGNKRHSPLLEFKIRNGFEEILTPRFYVPLTRWGALCIRMNLHRGALGILPPSVIAIGLAVRAKCHNLKYVLSRCSLMPERSNRNRQMECSNPPAGSNT